MSSRSKTIVLITGATGEAENHLESPQPEPDTGIHTSGYIGGSVLSRLLNLPDAQSKHEFRAVVRDAVKAKKLADGFGVTPIIGSHSDQKLIAKAAAEADVIVTTADCNDVDAATAINMGMKKRFDATGKRSILIHTSGTGVLADDALGDYTSDVIWDDENVAQLETLAPNHNPRPVELKVVSADEDGYAYTYIVSPSAIYDKVRNPLVDAGIANSRTIVFKLFVPISIKRGYGITIGKGENIWANVHIDEITDFFVLLFKAVLKDPRVVPHGKEGHFLIGADEHKSIQWYSEIAKVLFDLGKVKSPEPTRFTEEEAKQYFGEQAADVLGNLGGNARSASNRAKKLGWQPRKTTDDFIGSIREEVGFWVNNL
ncbi:hypothetical protein V5O48_012211 [Marasmius crinis-equi]|uniref:NAD(P)-binding domain-containing protein n=1 Tax=Marasmius crinis-equi TaxID=585013 RepID=A0ABR3F3S1_9AGAR